MRFDSQLTDCVICLSVHPIGIVASSLQVENKMKQPKENSLGGLFGPDMWSVGSTCVRMQTGRRRGSWVADLAARSNVRRLSLTADRLWLLRSAVPQGRS